MEEEAAVADGSSNVSGGGRSSALARISGSKGGVCVDAIQRLGSRTERRDYDSQFMSSLRKERWSIVDGARPSSTRERVLTAGSETLSSRRGGVSSAVDECTF